MSRSPVDDAVIVGVAQRPNPADPEALCQNVEISLVDNPVEVEVAGNVAMTVTPELPLSAQPKVNPVVAAIDPQTCRGPIAVVVAGGQRGL